MALDVHITTALQATDETGNHTLTWSGDATSGQGPANHSVNSIVLDSNDYVTTPNAGDFDRDEPFSASFWVKRASLSGFGVYLSRILSSGTFRGWGINSGSVSDRNRLIFNMLNSSSIRVVTETLGSLPDDEWIHITITYNGTFPTTETEDSIRIYFNGKPMLFDVTDEDLSTNTISTTAPFEFSGRNNGVNLIAGDYADIRVYDTELIASEVATIYELAIPDAHWTTLESSVFQRTSSVGDWVGRPWILEITDDLWMMTYRDSTAHSSSGTTETHIRFSTDEGATWSDEDEFTDASSVTGFPITADGSNQPFESLSMLAPNGDIILFIGRFSGQRHGIDQYRSTDNGATWSDEGQISVGSLDDELTGPGGQAVTIGNTIYVAHWVDLTPTGSGGPFYTHVIKSEDNGATWELLANLSTTTENTNEVGLVALDDTTLLTVIRGTDTGTYTRTVTTDGEVGPLIDITNVINGDKLDRPTL
jgi:hypothetical protein